MTSLDFKLNHITMFNVFVDHNVVMIWLCHNEKKFEHILQTLWYIPGCLSTALPKPALVTPIKVHLEENIF